jgi:hypothetical protein
VAFFLIVFILDFFFTTGMYLIGNSRVLFFFIFLTHISYFRREDQLEVRSDLSPTCGLRVAQAGSQRGHYHQSTRGDSSFFKSSEQFFRGDIGSLSSGGSEWSTRSDLSSSEQFIRGDQSPASCFAQAGGSSKGHHHNTG